MTSPHRIRLFGDPVLKGKCTPVDTIDDAIKQLSADMLKTMYEAPGVGLAAPQVGVSKRMFVFDAGKGNGPFVVINPEVTLAEGEFTLDEGCLSVPRMYFPVTRANRVEVKGTDLDGNAVLFSVEGFEAKILQHEIDHLDGILLLSRLTGEERKIAMRAIREREMKADTQ